MGKSLLEINYTKKKPFSQFNELVKNYIKKHKAKKVIKIIDYIYPLTKVHKDIYEIHDHINLSGFNPLKGPNFIALTDLYMSNNGITVAGLKHGIHPNKKEKSILKRTNVKAYCYNLVPTSILAASLGFKVKAIGIVNEKYTDRFSDT